MFAVCDYLFHAKMNGLKLKINLNDNDIKMISASENRKIWRTYLGDDRQILLPIYELFQQLLEFTFVLQGADWKKNAPYFTNYFQGSSFPKFILFSGHQKKIIQILKVIMNSSPTPPTPPASAIFFDFFNLNGEDRVRVFYKPNIDEEISILS